MKKIFAGLAGLAFLALTGIVTLPSAQAAVATSAAAAGVADHRPGAAQPVQWHHGRYHHRHRYSPRYGYRHRYRHGRPYYGVRSYGRRCGYWRRACVANWAPYTANIRGCLRYHGCY
jgi:hypothetical protein